MGRVAVLFRLMPHGVDTDLDRLTREARAAVPAAVTVRGSQVKDVAYGLRSLLLSVVMDDAGGLLASTEEALAKVPGVESVEVMEEGLL
jgi:elongation factor 1-beta